MPHLLLVDDDPEALEWLSELAKGEGFSVAQADSLRAARIHMTRLQPDVLLTDLQLPDGQGIELVGDLEARESTEVVLITGHASVESAVQALRLGASDYLVKPVDVERLRAILRRVPKTGELRAEIGELRDELRKLGRYGHILGSSSPMQKLYDQIGRVAPTSATVLLMGESGTGKELAAQTIHDLSRRKRAPFLPLNCGAVSPQLIESELFGHEKGSFTGADRQHKGYFERAHGGTLFLDEITEMPQELQVKLLRVLETGSFMRVGTTTPIAADVRLIAATNRNPEQAVSEGKLREDLYHRLNVFPMQMPPLRERGTDIELLAQHFLEQLNRQESAAKSFAPATVAALYAHGWPGNVRELKNYVQRAFILADEVIDANLAPASVAAPESAPLLTVRVGSTLEEVSRRLIEATLAECGSKRKAADMLGISLKTLYNRLAAYKSEPADERDAA
ncbi:MAG TPA: sigma-54 dependent transcriptional regulator [Burkholderiales bacterium]|jgi:DNA-binding NtrC family response regulator|nr:sigma-54 dependent transcriptional regulator [Burkholderiales bacterium]